MLTVNGEISPVRIAQPEDEDGLISMLRLMHQEGGLRDANDQPFPLCEERVRATVQQAILPNRNEPDAGQACCGIIGESGHVEASVCLVVTSTWYSEKPFLGDRWTFVHPEFRKTPHARTLVAFAKVVAATMRMPLLMGNMAAERTSAKDRFLERNLGVKRYGSTFVYHPDHTGAF